MLVLKQLNSLPYLYSRISHTSCAVILYVGVCIFEGQEHFFLFCVWF